MQRTASFILVLASFVLIPYRLAFAQDATLTATCNFDEEKQLAVEYQRMSVNPKKFAFGRDLPYNKVWTPGKKPMTLFTNTPLNIGGNQLPAGAYTMFVMPAQKQWTLIISKSTDMSGAYDQQKDLARIPMESGELGSPESQFGVYFAHVAPNQCSMRLTLANLGTWVIFQEK